MLFSSKERLAVRSHEVFIPLLLDNDQKEAQEKHAFTKGVVAFDIVFDATGTPFVCEIQSISAGVCGITEDLINDERISREVKDFAQSYQGNRPKSNPYWFNIVSIYKHQQTQFIPEQYRPKTIVNEDFESLFELGKVIIKPNHGAQGVGIRIFDAEQVDEAKKYAQKIKDTYGIFIAQSLIESRGADMAPEHLKNHNASLRLLVPFEVQNGKPVITQAGVGYQRIALKAMPDKQKKAGKYDKAGVVNRCRGAYSAPMSQHEYTQALPAVEAVLKNLVEHPEYSPAYQKEVKEAIDNKTNKNISSFHNEHIANQFYVFLASPSQSMSEAIEVNKFVQSVHREFDLLPLDIKRLLQNRLKVYVDHTSGTGGCARVVHSTTFRVNRVQMDFDAVKEPGVLVDIIERLVKR